MTPFPIDIPPEHVQHKQEFRYHLTDEEMPIQGQYVSKIELGNLANNFESHSAAQPIFPIIQQELDKLKWPDPDTEIRVCQYATTIFWEAIRQGARALKVSTSSDNRLMIYRTNSDGVFLNILIDEDSDISFLKIDENAKLYDNQFFDSEEGNLDFNFIASLLVS